MILAKMKLSLTPKESVFFLAGPELTVLYVYLCIMYGNLLTVNIYIYIIFKKADKSRGRDTCGQKRPGKCKKLFNKRMGLNFENLRNFL